MKDRNNAESQKNALTCGPLVALHWTEEPQKGADEPEAPSKDLQRSTMWEGIKAPTGPLRGHCRASPLLLRDGDPYSSAASSAGIRQLTAESLPWDSPLLEEICFPKDMPLLGRSVGQPVSNDWLGVSGRRGQRCGTLPSISGISEEPSQVQSSPRDPPRPPLAASEFSLALCLILRPSLPDWFPRPLPSQLPEWKSLPQSLFPGGLNLWQSRCQREQYRGHHGTTELSAVTEHVTVALSNVVATNCMCPLSTWRVPSA